MQRFFRLYLLSLGAVLEADTLWKLLQLLEAPLLLTFYIN